MTPRLVEEPMRVSHPKTPDDADWHGQPPQTPHFHIIDEDWGQGKKNRVAAHIDIWHSWRSA